MASSKRFIDYPRAGRTGVRRWLPSWKLLLSTVVLLVVLAFGALAAAVVFVRVPQPNDMARAQVTTFYWNDGQTVLGRMGEANRTNVPLSDVPQPVQHAVLAAEDRDFYEHGGFSPTALARAVWNNVRGGDTQGASTITQQYAKNAFLTQERSYIRKAKELVLSLKIETQISKDEILSNYMNTVYYGRSAYGIEAASQAYFGVPAKDLTVAQGAMLAALLQSPNGLSPTKNPQGLQDRWNYVLDGMVAKGWLTPAERAAQKFPEVKAYTPPANYYQGTDGYLFAAAQRDMLNHGFTEDQLNTEGLNVKTTFDRTAQAAAVDAVTNNSPGGEEEGLRIGLASVTPNTGAVVAMYGGPDYQKNQFNNASQARGQAGSTFKAFGLAAGLENNVGLDSYYDGNSPQRIDGQLIENEFNQSYGTISMLKATEDSVNTPYANMNAEIGPARTKESAVRAGIPDNTPGLIVDVTNVLGAASPTPLEMASAYGTFANRGKQTPYSMIQEVAMGNGDVVFQLQAKDTRAYDEAVSDEVTYALRKVVSQGTGTAAQGAGRPVAGKTGTSDNNTSAWFVGYAPQMSTAVMMVKNDANGNNVSLAGTGGMSMVAGGSYPAQIWTAYMSQAMADMPVEDFVDPANQFDDYVAPNRNNPDTAPPVPSFSPSESPTVAPTPTETQPTPTDSPTQPTTPPSLAPPAVDPSRGALSPARVASTVGSG